MKILLAIGLLFGLSACGGEGSTTSNRAPAPAPRPDPAPTMPLPPKRQAHRVFEHNNMGSAVTLPLDFFFSIDNPDTWAEARKPMGFYYLRRSSMSLINDDYLKKLADILNADNIKVVVNDASPTWAHKKDPSLAFRSSIREISRMLAAGMDVCCIAMQSTLSKRLKSGESYSMELRYADAEAYIRMIQNAFPGENFKFGLIDATPSHDFAHYKQIWGGLIDHLDSFGLPLDFFHLDMPFVKPRNHVGGMSWEGMDDIGDWVNDRGMDFGVFLHAAAKKVGSDAEWRERFLFGLEHYIDAGGDMDWWIEASWHEHPSDSVPDTIGLPTALGVFREMDGMLTRKGHANPKE